MHALISVNASLLVPAQDVHPIEVPEHVPH